MNTQTAIRLLQEACTLQHTALNTEKSYVRCLKLYAQFLQTLWTKIEAFLTQLALQGVSASTQNQAFNALLFFYRYALKQQLGNVNALRAKRPPTLRYCPDRTETLTLLAHVKDVPGYPTRLLVHLLYACGLRVCEPLNLRIKNLDLKGRRLQRIPGSTNPDMLQWHNTSPTPAPKCHTCDNKLGQIVRLPHPSRVGLLHPRNHNWLTLLFLIHHSLYFSYPGTPLALTSSR